MKTVLSIICGFNFYYVILAYDLSPTFSILFIGLHDFVPCLPMYKSVDLDRKTT